MSGHYSSQKKRFRLLAAVCGVAALIVAVLDLADLPPLSISKEVFLDELIVHGRKTAPNPNLIFVGIDLASMRLDALWEDEVAADPMLVKIRDSPGGWPWPRDVFAALARRVLEAGAKMVVFDLVLLSQAEGDEVLAALIDEYPGRVLVAGTITSTSGRVELQMPSPSILKNPTTLDPRIGLALVPGGEATARGRATVRKLRFRDSAIIHEKNWHTRFSTEMVEAQTYLTYPAQILRAYGRESEIPKDYGDHYFRYMGTESGIRMVPAYEVLFERTMEVFREQGVFLDKVVLIGPEAQTHHDFHRTPFGPMLGPMVILQQTAAALAGEFLKEPSVYSRLLFLLLAALAGFYIAWRIGHPTFRIALLLLGAALCGVAALLLYNYGNWLFNATAPMAMLLFVGASATVADFILERKERARVRGTLERCVSRNVVKEMLDNPESYLNTIGGVRKRVTMLFSDVRGFTTMSESADPTALVAQLNEYLSAMVEIVFEENGTLDKFMGDAVMAVWGNLQSDGYEADACHAVACALKMRKRLAQLNADWKARGIQELHIGIGVNHGEAIAGNIGSEQKMEPTVIGDAVNVASRLEGMSKTYGIDIIIGEECSRLASHQFTMRSVDLVRAKGKTTPSEIYTVLGEKGRDEVDVQWLNAVTAAVMLYRKGDFDAAVEAFEALDLSHPGDPLTELYLVRCGAFQLQPPGPHWDGVHIFTSK